MVTAQRRALVAVALFAGALRCATVEAGEANPTPMRPGRHPGFSFGARLGAGFALGDRARVAGVAESMSDHYSALLPIWFDAGYRLTSRLYVGGYFQYGILPLTRSGCPEPVVGCSAHDLRAGAAAHFHFTPDRAVDPWAGVGFGYEGSTVTYQGQIQSATRTNGGIEFANLQVGVDTHGALGVDWGMFASFSVNQYLTETQTPPVGEKKTYALSDETIHYFVVFGIRVQVDL